jgi:hypothetical protein
VIPDFTGLEYLLIVASVLLLLCAVGLFGPDPDLDEPWDPRA